MSLNHSYALLLSRYPLFPWCVGLLWLLVPIVIADAATEDTSEKRDLTSDFQAFVELAPFEVVDQHLTISVFARSKADRRYAEGFAEEVVDITS